MFPQRDPRTSEWALAGNKPFLVTLLVGYVYLVRYGGPRFMKTRKPYENLKPLILVYNFSMVLVNGYFFFCFLTGSYLGGGYNIICQGINYEASDRATMEVLELYWWYHWLRIADFLDTIFFVLRKKDTHVSLLHVGHHVLVVFNCWYGLAYGSDGQVTLTVVLNCFVHVVMYSYYFLSLLGPAIRPYLWWKRYLTGLQLVQFVVMFLHITIPVFNDCGYPKFHSVIIVCEAAFFFTMFARFYKKAYTHGRNSLRKSVKDKAK
ncbi:elongation of very long chain fatty acids protein AAEL008004 [Ixodes scapularis]